jgi:hypothetical protein
MPTAPDPNSPFLPARLEATLGVNAPGTPGMAGNPGVQAAGVQFPAPPAPNTGFPGRPTTPKAATPTAAVPTASKSTAPPSQAKKPSGGVQSGAQGEQPLAPVPGPKVVPGSDGSLGITPEGDMAYRQAVVAGRASLGPIPKLFRHPSIPELPFELGGHNWNPFTGTWVGPEGQQ